MSSSGLGALVVEVNTTHPTQDITTQHNKMCPCSTKEIGSALKKRKFRTGIIGGRKFKSWCQYFWITGSKNYLQEKIGKSCEDFPIITGMCIVTVCQNGAVPDTYFSSLNPQVLVYSNRRTLGTHSHFFPALEGRWQTEQVGQVRSEELLVTVQTHKHWALGIKRVKTR